MLPLTKTQQQVNNVFTINNIQQQITYLHGCAGFPPKTAWLSAIKNGFYDTWPIINFSNVLKYLHEPEPTVKGHLNQCRQNTRSTQIAPQSICFTDETVEAIYIAVHSIVDKIYTNQTGRFPVTSS